MTSVRQEAAARDADAEPPPETIESLFAALESPLLSYALRLLGERARAEDAVQDAFMKLHAQFSEIREPRRWLYRTVHNLALNQLRQANKIVPLPQPLEGENENHGTALGQSSAGGSPVGRGSRRAAETPDPDPLPDEQIVRLEGIGLVRLSLAALDARSRELIHLKFDEDLSYKEIAARTGLTIGHVGYLLHHALKTIAAELSGAGLAP